MHIAFFIKFTFTENIIDMLRKEKGSDIQMKYNICTIKSAIYSKKMRVKNKVYRSEKGDFNINNLTFEVGGKSKTQEQIKDLKNAYIVKDDIEYGYQNVLPLWAFGLNY